MKKILLVVIDGLGDERISQLQNKTPLEAAKTPNLNLLAKKGVTGLVLPYFEKGKDPTSEDTHLALFGYSPKIYNPGRGVLEVLGMDLKILATDVCLRGNFATIDENLKIIDRRAGRIEKTKDLIKAISQIEIEGIKFLIKKGVSHRIGIIMRGRGLSPKISDSDPKITGVRPRKIKPLESSKEADFTAKVLNQFLEKVHQVLKEHPLNKKRKLPANYILTRGAGRFRKVPSFKEKYALKSACIAGAPLYKGIAKFLGMEIIKVKGANALPSTNLKGKFLAAKREMKNYDFIFLHIKAADNLGEDGNFLGKKEFIERIDKNLEPILKLKNSLITITGDHATCSLLKKHCRRPLPILVYGNGQDLVEIFSERASKKGDMGVIKQIKVMSKILEISG